MEEAKRRNNHREGEKEGGERALRWEGNREFIVASILCVCLCLCLRVDTVAAFM